jgi:hypothetical protein
MEETIKLSTLPATNSRGLAQTESEGSDSVLYFRVFTELLDNELVDSKELADKLDTTPAVIRDILSNSKFIQKFHEVKTNLEKIKFDINAFRELSKIVTDGRRDSDKISAIKLMHDMLFPKESKGMTVNVNIDKVLDELGGR